MYKKNNIFSINQKVVVISGISGQLGTAIAKYLSNQGAIVIGIDKVINDKYKNITYYKLDITKKNQIKKIFQDIVIKYKRIDVLINNAGAGVFNSFENRKESEFNFVVDVNLKGTFFCIKEYVKLFDKFNFEEGSIINIASLYGIISSDPSIYMKSDRKNSEVYSASKAGVIQLTKYFGVHLAERNIRVNAISPGGIYNPKNPQGKKFIENYSARCPMKRMGNENEIIGAVIYLSTNASSYVTGQNIIVDGGFSSW